MPAMSYEQSSKETIEALEGILDELRNIQTELEHNTPLERVIYFDIVIPFENSIEDLKG